MRTPGTARTQNRSLSDQTFTFLSASNETREPTDLIKQPERWTDPSGSLEAYCAHRHHPPLLTATRGLDGMDGTRRALQQYPAVLPFTPTLAFLLLGAFSFLPPPLFSYPSLLKVLMDGNIKALSREVPDFYFWSRFQ